MEVISLNFNKEKFSEILKHIRDSYGSINKMAAKTGVTTAYISKLIRLQYSSPPSPEILYKISENSNNIVDYNTLMIICGYLDNPNINTNNFRIEYINFNYIQYNKLNDIGQKKVNDYIQDLIDTNKYNK